MGQVIADAPGNGKSVILNNDVNATCGIAGGSCIDSDKTPFAQRTMRHLSARGRARPLWITAAFLATTWASETQAFPEARHAQADASASARHATAGRILGLGRTAGDGDFTTVQASRRGDKSVQLAQTTTSDTRELQQAVEQERGRAEKLARELAVTRRDLELLLTQLNRARDESARVKQAAESEAAELRKALQQERDRASRLKQESERDTNELRKSLLRDRAERLERDLAATRRDVEPRTSPAAKAGDDATQLKQAAESTVVELRKSLQQERDRAGRLEQDLVAARRGVETQTALAAKASGEATRLKQAAGSGAVELRKSLQQEQERAKRLEQDLAAARHDVETQTAQATKASDEATRLKQVADSGSAELKRSLQQERDRAEALAQDLSMARTNIYAHEAQARKAGDQAADLNQAVESAALELRKSLQQERERAERLEQDLAAARRDVETQTALAAKASAEAAQLKQLADSGSEEPRISLQQERDTAARLERDLAFERNTKAAPAAPEVVIADQSAQDKQLEADATKRVAADQASVAAARDAAPPNPEDAAEVARLVARASVLLGQGDIGSARIVLERAAETGNAQASFTLAETYDPLILPKWGTYGTRGDATKARDLYARAEAGGIKEAKARFDALRR
jgi:hypothetical protein